MKPYAKDQVDVITLNYNGKAILPLLFDSLRKITYTNNKIHMVDNGSSDGSADFVAGTYPEVNIIRSNKNLFFSRGNNLAIKQTNSEFILLVNNDIVVTPDFLSLLVDKIKEDKNIAAVAPKMLFNDHPTILDSVGTVINNDGSPFNRGIGQPDVGQYDKSEQIFGACFGCVLLRREYYENEIGGLDNMYFGYFEDIDWCFRANLFGFKIVTEPKSVVYHAHSVSTRKNTPLWKLFLIHRNFIWTIQKNFAKKRALVKLAKRYIDLFSGIMGGSGQERIMYLRILMNTIVAFPVIFFKRILIQSKRKVLDKDIFKYADNESPFFEDVTYNAVYTLDNLENAFEKIRFNSPEITDIYRSIVILNKEQYAPSPSWKDDAKRMLDKLKNYIDPAELEHFRQTILN